MLCTLSRSRVLHFRLRVAIVCCFKWCIRWLTSQRVNVMHLNFLTALCIINLKLIARFIFYIFFCILWPKSQTMNAKQPGQESKSQRTIHNLKEEIRFVFEEKKKYAFNRHENTKFRSCPVLFCCWISMKHEYSFGNANNNTISLLKTSCKCAIHSSNFLSFKKASWFLFFFHHFNSTKNLLLCFILLLLYFDLCFPCLCHKKRFSRRKKDQHWIWTIFKLHNLNFEECKQNDCLWDYDQNFVGLFPFNSIWSI